MPLNVRRFYTSVLLSLISLFAVVSGQTQTALEPQFPRPQAAIPSKPPTSGEIMRERISKAKAFIAVRNYNAAIYELENIRRETSDASVNAVTNVLLMNSFLEQGDYKRAQDLLTEFFNAQKLNKPNASAYYSAVAGQVVKGARNQIDRYRALGLAVSDRNLPLEAVNDIERMRETLEIVVTQAKAMGADKAKSAGAMAMLEESTNARSAIARDDYDARRWRDEIADSREQLANSRSVIINAVDGTITLADAPQQTDAANTTPLNLPETSDPTVFKPVTAEIKPAVTEPAVKENEPAIEEVKKAVNKILEEPKQNRSEGDQTERDSEPKKKAESVAAEKETPGGPLQVGSLLAYATKQTAPVYPPAARNMRAAGVVKVEVTVNEDGEVAEVQRASGHTMLQTAAKDAIKKWKFKPFVRDGRPVKAMGFVNFNFSL